MEKTKDTARNYLRKRSMPWVSRRARMAFTRSTTATS